MKNILLVLITFLFSVSFSFSQIEKPKNDKATKLNQTTNTSAATSQAIVEVTWNGNGNAIIHIGDKTISLAKGTTGELRVMAGTSLTIKVEKPAKTYTYVDFVLFEPGKNYLKVDLKNELVSVNVETERQNQDKIAAEKSARQKFKSDSVQKVVDNEKVRIALNEAKRKQAIDDSIDNANALIKAGRTQRKQLITDSITATHPKIGEPIQFTPNNDGITDVLEFNNLEYYPNTKLEVFDRWGVLVYENNNYLNDWNGKKNGTGIECADGVYYYILSGQLLNDEIKGYVNLIRGK